MVSRLATALAGLVASLLVSATVYWYTGSLLVFLFVPFVPFLFSRGREDPPARECPECGFRTSEESFDYCPRDGARLE